MTPEQIAELIVQGLEKRSGPEESTWGLAHGDAHHELFTTYRQDLVDDIVQTLKACEGPPPRYLGRTT